MEANINPMAGRNERFAGECLRRIKTAPDPEEGLRRLLRYLGLALECDRVYVFEEMDRQHIRNTYEWCREGISSGISQLPYLAKKDLSPWYRHLTEGGNIIQPQVESLKESDPLIYQVLKQQHIRTIVLSPLLLEGKTIGFLGADNPPPEKLEHISILLDVLAYFVGALISRRELQRLQQKTRPVQSPGERAQGAKGGKTVLLVDDSPELLRLNQRILRSQGYRILTARSLWEAAAILEETVPEVMVLDVDLPDGDGIDFYRRLKASIPVVFLTARSEEEAAREGFQAGGCAFLTKPYQLEELQEAVAETATPNEEPIRFHIEGRNARSKKKEELVL